jgi:CheY-like chemotaxis protein
MEPIVDKEPSDDLQGLSTAGMRRECIMKIMIADRDENLLDGLRETLHQSGHETQIATGGLECISLLRDEPPDMLALGDGLLWGGGDGVLDVMAHEETLQEIPVLLLVEYGKLCEFLRHPLVISVIRYPAPLSDLARQFVLVKLLCDSNSFASNGIANPKCPLSIAAGITESGW